MRSLFKRLSILAASLATVFGIGLTNKDAQSAKALTYTSTYVKITSTSDLTTDDKVVIGDLDGTFGMVTGWNSKKDATVGATESDWVRYEVTAVSNGFYLFDSSQDTYIGSPGSSNQFVYNTNPGLCSVNSDGVLTCNNRYLCKNSSYYRMYGSIGSFSPLYVYKEITSTKMESITIKDTNGDVINSLNLTVNDMYEINVSYSPTDVDDTTINWTTTNDSVAEYTGDSSGDFILAYASGTATITATANDGGGATASVTVYVAEAGAPQLTGITVSGTVKTPQYVGNDFDYTGLSFTPVYDITNDSPDTITGSDITWPSLTEGMTSITGQYKGIDVVVSGLVVENDAIETIAISGDMITKTYNETQAFNANGLVVTGTYKSGKTEDVTSSSTFTFEKTTEEIGVGTDKSVKVTATYNLITADITITGLTITEAPVTGDAQFVFSTDNKSTLSPLALSTTPATIDDITISLSQGTSSSNPTSDMNPAKFYKNHVLTISGGDSVESITSIVATASTTGYASALENATFSPSASVTSSDTEVTISGFANGTKEVKITFSDAQVRLFDLTVNYDKVQVDDNQKVTSISVSPDVASIEVNKTITLEATALPGNAYDRSITWSSEQTNIATVDQDGVVTGVAIGTATIKATANDGSGVYGTATITVTAGVTIEFNASAKIADGMMTATGADFYVTSIGGSYRGYEGNRGSQFSSSTNAILINFETVGHSITLNGGDKIYVNASRTGTATASQLSVYVGDTQIGDTKTLTTSAADYEFEAQSGTDISGVLKIVMSANGGIYLKSIKAYSPVTALSEDITNLNKLVALMKVTDTCNDYTKYNDYKAAYDALSEESKVVFDSTIIIDGFETDENIEAGVTVTLGEKLSYMGALYAQNTTSEAANNLLYSNLQKNNLAIVLLIGLSGLAAVAAYYFINKKKYC